MTSLEFLHKLANTAPMVVSSAEIFSALATALVTSTKAMASTMRFDCTLKNRSITVNSTPSSAPPSSASAISSTGFKMLSTSETSAVLVSVCATATAMPNAMSAVASSMATTLSSVSVTGPLALYCLMTIMVAAGAVAAAIAPNTNENGSVCPLRTSPSVTNKTATKLSNMAMTIGVMPTRLK